MLSRHGVRGCAPSASVQLGECRTDAGQPGGVLPRKGAQLFSESYVWVDARHALHITEKHRLHLAFVAVACVLDTALCACRSKIVWSFKL
jgi:hypothetical protein